MDRIDGKGHHPKVRVKHWTDKIRSKRRKHVIKNVLPATRQLFMLRTETGYSTTKTDRYVYGAGIVTDTQLSAANTASLTTTVVEAGCTDAGTWYVDTKGCGMQQATPSNSPPRHGFIRNLMRYAASILLIALMAFLAACHKDPTPQPNPDHPTDPIIPTKEITIHWDWFANLGWAPPKDSIKYYTDQDSVKFVDINLIGLDGIGYPVNSTGFHPGIFHIARDTLQTRIDIDPAKVKLSGTILVNSRNGATFQNHNPDQGLGMAYYDSIWFTDHGCIVRRPIYSK